MSCERGLRQAALVKYAPKRKRLAFSLRGRCMADPAAYCPRKRLVKANPDLDQEHDQDQEQDYQYLDDGSATLDGSAASARRVLAELAGLMDPEGQDGLEQAVLELEIGVIIARAFVERIDGVDVLTVSARLPAGAGAACLSVQAPEGVECLWHADLGCPMTLRRIALTALPSERALMDAILAAADAAQRWHVALNDDTKGKTA